MPHPTQLDIQERELVVHCESVLRVEVERGRGAIREKDDACVVSAPRLVADKLQHLPAKALALAGWQCPQKNEFEIALAVLRLLLVYRAERGRGAPAESSNQFHEEQTR